MLVFFASLANLYDFLFSLKHNFFGMLPDELIIDIYIPDFREE